MSTNTCKTCPAFHNKQCRAAPPTNNGWPLVAETDFCCEHPQAGLMKSGILQVDLRQAIEHLGNVWQDFH